MSASRCCILCGHKKPMGQFARKKDGKDGRSPRCKTCAAVRQALYRQSPEGIAVAQAYLSSHPEIRDKNLDKLNRWRRANPERVKELKREYNKTPLARAVRARRRAVIQSEKSESPESQARWQEKISLIDQEIQSYRHQDMKA